MKNTRRTLVAIIALAMVTPLFAQEGLTTKSRVDALRWRNIGPANMTGRIASIDALNTDHRIVLVASASGGVFLSDNAGVTWDPIFDKADGAGSIGAAVLFQGDPDVIWVGTGEAANRNSTGWGDGLWRTTDGGDTWQHVGLEDSGHIAEIATHPTNPDIAYVAVPGHLWGYSGIRGLYKTIDGGVTWEKLLNGLPDDGKTGSTEIIMDPDDPDTLYTGFYHRIRQPATMYSGGEQGGLFKSTDAGATWTKLTAGLPEVTGMIDVAIHRTNPRVVVAAVEADDDIPYFDEDGGSEDNPGGGIYISRDAGATWRWSLRTNVRPFYHGQVDIDPLDPNRIYSVGREFKVTRDGGDTWGNRWWGGGGDDHDFWIAPYDGSIWYTATDQGAYITVDDGATIVNFDNMAIGQYYKVGADLRDPYWVGGGLQDNAIWMGPSNSREVRGVLNMHNTWLAEGDGFATWFDPEDWRIMYGVNHVGFAIRLNTETRDATFITPTPETVGNFAEFVDHDFPDEPIRYTIDPGEHWFRYGRPERPLLPPQFRFNWDSPFLVSPNDPAVIYFAGNHLFRSADRGDSWQIISPDLSTNDPELRNPTYQGGLTRSVTGGENHFTIFTIAESPHNPDLIWAGTDDGNVQVTRDGGDTWTNVRDNLPGIPERAWINKIEASHHAECRAYLTINNHRVDDFRPYVFRTQDCGESWTDIGSDLPADGSSYVTVEDPLNENLLFVGTEWGVWTTLDGGNSWARLDNNLPKVAVRDLVIHPREGDLIAGTHGRSIWILDDLSPLRQSSAETLSEPAHLFAPRRTTDWIRINLGRKQSNFLFRGENPPRGAILDFHLASDSDDVSLRIEGLDSDRTVDLEVDALRRGLNRVIWDLRFGPSTSDVATFIEGLERAMATLQERVPQVDHDALNAAREALRPAEVYVGPAVMLTVNGIRSQLVTAYGAYAWGEPLFPARLDFARAAPGQYRVVLTVDGVRHEQELIVRADPMRDQ
ncbi:MAG: hypothetical protein GKS06_19150 [Acidobacteria bacterium]|nr:hypothetical protein [Acidobacteriota bacterium]